LVGEGWRLVYNPHERTWQFGPPGATEKYNAHHARWEVAGADWQLQYNPHAEEWKYAPP
jgi:hypothetical protein